MATEVLDIGNHLQSVLPAAKDFATSTQGHDYLAPVELPFTLPTKVYGAMLAVWYLQPGLQRRFPLQELRARDYVRYLAWCVTEGRKQYRILREISEWDAELAQPITLPKLRGDSWSSNYSVAMFLFGVARHRYTFTAMLTSASARATTARAYWRGERHSRRMPAPSAWQFADLRRRFDTLEAMVGVVRAKDDVSAKPLTQYLDEFGLADVASAFEQGGACRDTATLTVAALPKGLRRSPVRLPLKALRGLNWLAERGRRRLSEAELASVTARIQRTAPRTTASKYPFGVNLFGYARGEIGIGEDVRLVALALQANGIPFCIVNVKPGDKVSQQDRSADMWITDEPRYAINIFCITGFEQTRFVCEHGLGMLRDRYTVVSRMIR